jgi:hypothetical protein
LLESDFVIADFTVALFNSLSSMHGITLSTSTARAIMKANIFIKANIEIICERRNLATSLQRLNKRSMAYSKNHEIYPGKFAFEGFNAEPPD